MTQPFNIIYFVCHDLGRHLGCYGRPVATPHIDAFARDGVQFNNAHCSSPACSPSRACAMTGQYAHVNGCIGLSHMGWGLRPEVPTIVEHLSAAGYETAHAGTEHEWHPHSGRYDREGDRSWDDWTTSNALQDARTFLNTRNHNKPFYLNIGTQEVHSSQFTQPNIVESRYGGPTPADQTHVPPYLENNGPNRRFMANFQSAIRHLDQQWGDFISFLNDSQYADNTLIVFTTDHGISLPHETPRCSKGTLYERGTAITLAMRLPKDMKQGYCFDGLIPNIDLTPTLLDMAGAPVPPALNGQSFWPLLQNKPYQPNEHIFTERNYHGEIESPNPTAPTDYIDLLDPIRSIRTPQYHYLRWFDPQAVAEPTLWANACVNDPHSHERLYDCQHDPMQTIDLKDRPEYASILADLRHRLEQWMQNTDDWLLHGTPPQRPDEPGWGKDWPRLAKRQPWDGQ